jgi:hypothetical protein
MKRHKFFEPSLAATLLLPVLTGCVYLNKSTPPAAPLLAVAPTIEPPPLAPLYLTMSQNDPSLPELPAPPPPGAQPAPPPASVIVDTTKKPARPGRHRGRKEEVEVAERESHEKAREHEAPATTTPAPDNAPPTNDAQNVNVTAPTPSGDTTASTPIGQLTAGPTQDAAGSKRQTTDLIDITQRGVNGLHRNLNGEQVKTVAQIRSFLDQAQRAMHNGDVDGAYTLATKAKTLLDELTGAS